MNFGTRLFKALKVSSKKFKINTKTSQGARARWLKQGRWGGFMFVSLDLGNNFVQQCSAPVGASGSNPD